MKEEYYSRSSIMNALLYNLSEDEAKEMMTTIEVIGAADVAPVIHGHWKYEQNEGHSIYTGECSVCGYRRRIDQFCGRCGAKMDGEKNYESKE